MSQSVLTAAGGSIGALAAAEDLRDALAGCPLLPVVVVGERTDGAALGEALVAGGLTAAEVVLHTPAAVRVLAELAPTPGLLVGAGAVVEPAQVDAAVRAGAAFVVSPRHDPGVVSRAFALGVAAVPGVSTAGEVRLARRSGLRLLGVRPAGGGGAKAPLQGLAGRFPDVSFIPAAGTCGTDLEHHLAQRSVAAVGGSWCTPAALVAQVTSRRDDAAVHLASAVRAAVAACRAARP